MLVILLKCKQMLIISLSSIHLNLLSSENFLKTHYCITGRMFQEHNTLKHFTVKWLQHMYTLSLLPSSLLLICFPFFASRFQLSAFRVILLFPTNSDCKFSFEGFSKKFASIMHIQIETRASKCFYWI